MLLGITRFTKQHDIFALARIGQKKNEFLDENGKSLEAEIFRAVYRYEQLNYLLSRLGEDIEKAKIPFIPLKDSIIRKYYLQPWMGTGYDIDILLDNSNIGLGGESSMQQQLCPSR